MVDIKELTSTEDISVKQLFFFYELCKLGVIRFDLNKEPHVKVLKEMVTLIANFKEADYLDKPLVIQQCAKVRNQLHILIIFQLMKHAIPYNK